MRPLEGMCIDFIHAPAYMTPLECLAEGFSVIFQLFQLGNKTGKSHVRAQCIINKAEKYQQSNKIFEKSNFNFDAAT